MRARRRREGLRDRRRARPSGRRGPTENRFVSAARRTARGLAVGHVAPQHGTVVTTIVACSSPVLDVRHSVLAAAARNRRATACAALCPLATPLSTSPSSSSSSSRPVRHIRLYTRSVGRRLPSDPIRLPPRRQRFEIFSRVVNRFIGPFGRAWHSVIGALLRRFSSRFPVLFFRRYSVNRPRRRDRPRFRSRARRVCRHWPRVYQEVRFDMTFFYVRPRKHSYRFSKRNG